MPHRVELQHNKASLRKRLLVGSISLSLLIIMTLCYVGHNILLDMERDIEQSNFNSQMPRLINLFTQKTGQQATIKANVPDNLALVLSPDGPLYAVNNENLSALLSQLNNEDQSFIAVNDRHYYLKKAQLHFESVPVTFVWEAKALDNISATIVNKLTLAAFITFLLSVWAALLMSAFIAKRFETANKTLEKLALQDPLTKLPNRNALLDSKLFTINRGALFFLDLDRFREINDALGHDMGDRMLFAFSQRLKNIAGKTATVYRYRSDEFVIWQPDMSQEDVLSRAFTLLYDCREPLNVGNSDLEMSCSIGVACLPEHGHHPEMLIRNAENAMRRAKRLRLGVQVYNERLAYNSTMKVTLRSQLRSALQNNEFVLYYQPKVDINSGRLAGVEAIVRWQHPEEGLLFPALFIELIEQSGIVHAFTRYTVEQAVNQIKEWNAMGFLLPVSVNLSAYNLMDNAFVPFVRKLLDSSGITPSLLEFELTESATMVDISVTKRVLAAFKDMGIKTSIDDFGTGMSSFAYLRELDIHTLKLDQSFIRNLERGSRNAKIVESIVSMCRNLGIDTIAEGVETTEQARILTELDCFIAQGYLFGKPMPKDDILAVMQANRTLPAVVAN